MTDVQSAIEMDRVIAAGFRGGLMIRDIARQCQIAPIRVIDALRREGLTGKSPPAMCGTMDRAGRRNLPAGWRKKDMTHAEELADAIDRHYHKWLMRLDVWPPIERVVDLIVQAAQRAAK